MSILLHAVNLVLIVSFLPSSSQSLQTSRLPADLLGSLKKWYDMRIRPDDDAGPVIVTVDMYIRALYNIDVRSMSFDADFTLRQTWSDPRLTFQRTPPDPEKYIGAPKLADSIWKPDLFFTNSRHATFHAVTSPNALVRIYPNGTVVLHQRITSTFFCHMNLVHFPFDQQKCSIKLASFGYSMDELRFAWKEENPVTINTGIKLPQFRLAVSEENYPVEEITKYLKSGNYSELQVNCTMNRDYEYHVVQSLVPCVFLVICSWLSFWLHVQAAPARVALGVTTFLAIYTQSAAVRYNLPPVSYLKAIDVWFIVCNIFIFLSLLEFALVNYFTRRSAKVDKGIEAPEPAKEQETKYTAESERVLPKLKRHLSHFTILADEEHRKAKHVDIVARVLFPVAFCFFLILFWSIYGASSQNL
ncbi:PREDICTED: glycine receptor subunit alpha-3-like [Priapulus caudatus]|uniref:Glycine receptor subunit alpha-3-like n=1 Tax=Priapulus caudatus TaxID=37621 RepID=A0ABM1DS00_PRICU|nr:PREDICTED: glycine receptor subunit alpha-3-like [Priapulus caudatus]